MLTRRNWDGNTRQSHHKWFVIAPKLVRSSLTKMAKMADGGKSCQHSTIKRGVARLCVSQFQEKKPRGRQWSPDFSCIMSPIWVSEASVARESSALGEECWSGTAAVRRRFSFWNASCALSVHSNIFSPPFRRSVKGRNTCAQFGKKQR